MPNDRELLAVVARGWTEFAFAFVEDDFESLPNDAAHADERQRLVQRATALYDRAFQFATRLVQDDDAQIESALRGDVASLRQRPQALPKRAVPGLVFGGMALASAIIMAVRRWCSASSTAARRRQRAAIRRADSAGSTKRSRRPAGAICWRA